MKFDDQIKFEVKDKVEYNKSIVRIFWNIGQFWR